MALALVKVDKLFKGLMTSADKEVFENVKIQPGSSNVLIKFTYENETYYKNWLDRVNGTEISGENDRVSQAIKMDVGGLVERIGDGFLFNQLSFLMINGIYNVLSSTDQGNIPKDLKDVFDSLKSIRASNPELFTIDLKTSLISAMEDIVNREKEVKNIVKSIEAEEAN